MGRSSFNNNNNNNNKSASLKKKRNAKANTLPSKHSKKKSTAPHVGKKKKYQGTKTNSKGSNLPHLVGPIRPLNAPHRRTKNEHSAKASRSLPHKSPPPPHHVPSRDAASHASKPSHASKRKNHAVTQSKKNKKQKTPTKEPFSKKVKDALGSVFSKRKTDKHTKTSSKNAVVDHHRSIPWWSSSLDTPSDDSSSPHEKTVWDQLDEEVLAFGNYVRLTAPEVQVRQDVVAQLQSTAQETLGCPQSELQIFGSFAALDVCLFSSDVDVALWGFLPTPKPKQHIRFSQPQESQAQQRQVTLQAAQREARIDKWRQVLQQGEAALTTECNQEGEGESQTFKKEEEGSDTGIVKGEEMETGNVKVESETLLPFVLDRTGDPVDAAMLCPNLDDSTTRTPGGSDPSVPNVPVATDNNNNQDIVFEIDREGAKELGGELLEAKESTVENKNDSQSSTVPDKKLVTNDLVDATSEPQSEDEEAIVPWMLLPDAEDDNHSSPVNTAIASNAVISESERSSENEKGNQQEVIEIDHSDEATSSDDDDDDDSADKLEALNDTQRGKPQDSSPPRGKLNCDWIEILDCDDNQNDQPAEDSRTAVKDNNPEVIEIDDDSNDQSDGDSCNKDDKLKERKQRSISLCSSTTCSEDEASHLQTSSLEVSLFASPPPQQTLQAASPNGPKGHMRFLVVGALQKLGRTLRRSGFTRSLHVRHRARIPIINMQTNLGFECDISVGGHTGADTSRYAARQIERFQSFAPVILVLKVLLFQRGLDKPFTGGLGSFKLYVLLAYHLERHLERGGSDRPGEVLVSFFERYGGKNGSKKGVSTRLSQNRTIDARDGGSADLSGVFQIDRCVSLFASCSKRLAEGFSEPSTSFLRRIVYVEQLRGDRDKCRRSSAKVFESRTRTAEKPPEPQTSRKRRRSSDPSRERKVKRKFRIDAIF